MKLTPNWHSHNRTHKPKRVGPKPKIPGKLSGLSDSAGNQQSPSIDEVRRQVVLMSSLGFREAVRPSASKPSPKGNGRKQHAKPRRGAKE